MPPEDGASGAQAATGSQAQAATQADDQGSGAGEAGAAQQGSGSETAEERADRLERELAETRREAGKYRTQARTLEQQQQAAAQAGLTELEREKQARAAAEQQAATLTSQLRDQALRTAAVAAATKLNFRNPELAYRLLNAGEVEYTDEGQPKNVESLLRDIAKAETYLTKPAGQDFGGGTRGQQGEAQPTMNDILRGAFGKG